MNNAINSVPQNYWEDLSINDSDLEFLYNYLLDIETPQDLRELTQALIGKRISTEKQKQESKRKDKGKIFFPRESYQQGDLLLFPHLDWAEGTVVSTRTGNNPEQTSFKVIRVEFSNGERKDFASELPEHSLNQASPIRMQDPKLDEQYVAETYGQFLENLLAEELRTNPDLVQIAGKWFPRALLVDVNMGHLNLAEAVLEESNGGPLPTSAILEQIDMPTEGNPKLAEFSLNLALQEDGRFDEVGPTGEVLWFLRRLEPEDVREAPVFLQWSSIAYDTETIQGWIDQLDGLLFDELQPSGEISLSKKELTISLSFPHWRSGTLPLTGPIKKVFPSALESPRIRFSFVDEETGKKSPGWVVRPFNYICGLRSWYLEQGLFPGALVQIKKSTVPGEIIISAQKHRANREWMRTVLIGADGGIVFALLKQLVSAKFDERMAIAIPDQSGLDQIWEQNRLKKIPLESTLLSIMRELSKLSPQGHVHAQELYACINIVRRCPPGPIFNILRNHKTIKHMGDLYFRIIDEQTEEDNYAQ